MQPNYSNTIYGSVVSITHEGQTAIRPTGKTKLVTKTWDVGAHTYICPDDPRFSVTISLGDRTAEVSIPDIDPLWQQWLDAGLITEEMLLDVPKPQFLIDAEIAEQFESSKKSKLAKLTAWWDSVTWAGIEVNGVRLPADKTSLATLRLDAVTAMQNPQGQTLLYDVAGFPHLWGNADLLSYAAQFQATFEGLLAIWNTKITTIASATTINELNAIDV